MRSIKTSSMQINFPVRVMTTPMLGKPASKLGFCQWNGRYIATSSIVMAI